MALSPLATSTELSVYDAVSRAVRWFRADWRLFCRRFLLISVVYDVLWHIIYWLGDHMAAPNAVFAVILTLALLIVVHFEIGSRMLASWRVISGKEADFGKALKESRRLRVLLLFLPVILSELFLAFVILSAHSLMESNQVSDRILVLILFLGLLSLVVPQSCMAMWTCFWAYVTEIENSSPFAGLQKVFKLQSGAPFYTFWIFVFFGSALVAVTLPILLFETMGTFFRSIPNMPSWLEPILKELFELALSTVCQLVNVSYGICGAAFMYRMLKMRFDGVDISEKLHDVRKKEGLNLPSA